MTTLDKADLTRLDNWSNMEYVGEYLDHSGALNKNVSKEGFESLTREYFEKLKRRIAYCENIEPKDEFIFYTLAELYDRVDPDESDANLYKRSARYYAIRAIRKNKKYSKAWALLADICSWISFIEGNKKRNGNSIYFAEKAITCLKKAIKYNPENKKYREVLKCYYHLRNEEYKH